MPIKSPKNSLKCSKFEYKTHPKQQKNAQNVTTKITKNFYPNILHHKSLPLRSVQIIKFHHHNSNLIFPFKSSRSRTNSSREMPCWGSFIAFKMLSSRTIFLYKSQLEHKQRAHGWNIQHIVQFLSLIKHTRIYVFSSRVICFRRTESRFTFVVSATGKRFNENLLKIAHERAIFGARSDNVDGGLALVVCLMVVFAVVFCWALLW